MNLYEKRLTVADAAVVCNVPADWLRQVATVVDDTLTLGAAFAAADGYKRDYTAETLREKRILQRAARKGVYP